MVVYTQVNSPCLKLKKFDVFYVENDGCEKKLKKLAEVQWTNDEGWVRLYEIDNYYIVTNDDTYDEVVISIASTAKEAIEEAKLHFVKLAKMYYRHDQETADEAVREIEDMFKSLMVECNV